MIGYQDNSGIYIDAKEFQKKLQPFYTLKNLEKVKEIRQGNTWRARNMPDNFEHWWIQGDQVKIPPGLLGTPMVSQIERKQVHHRTSGFTFAPTLREDQVKAVTDLLKLPVGIMNADTSTGKSYMVFWLAAHLKRKTLVVVHSSMAVQEMVKKCQEFLGHTPITVGGKKKHKPTTSDITVCLINSAEKLNLYEYGAIIIDECDKMCSTEIRQKLWYHCSPDYLYGLTATLKINNQEESLINIFFGQVTATIKGLGVPMKVKAITSRFVYRGSTEKNSDFSKLMSIISEDEGRNEFIANHIADVLPQSETMKGLVLVKRTEQAFILQRMLQEKKITAFVIIGDNTDQERSEIKTATLESSEPVVIIGSEQILGRGYDFPMLQCIWITYPNRFDENLIQCAGRVARAHEKKTYGIVYDVADPYVGILRRQFESRCRVYKKKYGVVVKS